MAAAETTFVRGVVLEALHSVDQARQKCLIAGYYLDEIRREMGTRDGRTSHDGKSSIHGRNQHSGADQFLAWLHTNIPEIPKTTAYRWMQAATEVASALDLAPAIEVDAEVIPMSRLLTLPPAELPDDKTRAMRQAWFDFTADKTIKECISGVLVEGDPESRMKRAINGKTKGGHRGEDRKDWPTYVNRHLVAITGLLGAKEENREKRWQGMSALQRQTIQDALSTALSRWPTPLVEHLAKVAKHETAQR